MQQFWTEYLQSIDKLYLKWTGLNGQTIKFILELNLNTKGAKVVQINSN